MVFESQNRVLVLLIIRTAGLLLALVWFSLSIFFLPLRCTIRLVGLYKLTVLFLHICSAVDLLDKAFCSRFVGQLLFLCSETSESHKELSHYNYNTKRDGIVITRAWRNDFEVFCSSFTSPWNPFGIYLGNHQGIRPLGTSWRSLRCAFPLNNSPFGRFSTYCGLQTTGSDS